MTDFLLLLHKRRKSVTDSQHSIFFPPCSFRQAGTCAVLLFYNRSYAQQLRLEGTDLTFWDFDVNLIFCGVRKSKDITIKQAGLHLSVKFQNVDQNPTSLTEGEFYLSDRHPADGGIQDARVGIGAHFRHKTKPLSPANTVLLNLLPVGEKHEKH